MAVVGLSNTRALKSITEPASFDHQFPIHIRRLQILTKGFWTVPDAAFVPECTLDEVQRVIDKKNKRVASYRNKCDVIWLVIVVDGFALSSTVNFSDEVCEYLYRSDFDRVFIFENAAERSLELKIAIHSNQILGRTTAIIKGVARTPGTYESVIKVRSGQTMIVHITSSNNGVEFSVETPNGDWAEGSLGVTDWSGPLEYSGDYKILTTNNRSRVQRNPRYTLEVNVR